MDSPDSRNGSSPKTIGTEVGDVGLDQPRDRNSSFASKVVPKGARRLGGLEDMIISLYAGGMTVRDIQHHLAATIGSELSAETISNVTEAVAEEVTAWQSRPLEAFYPVIYLDALVVKIRDGAHLANRAAHIAVGVDMDGIKHVLGIWRGQLGVHPPLQDRLDHLRQEPAPPGQRHSTLARAGHQPIDELVREQLPTQPASPRIGHILLIIGHAHNALLHHQTHRLHRPSDTPRSPATRSVP